MTEVKPTRGTVAYSVPRGWKLVVPLDDLTWGQLRRLAKTARCDDDDWVQFEFDEQDERSAIILWGEG